MERTFKFLQKNWRNKHRYWVKCHLVPLCWMRQFEAMTWFVYMIRCSDNSLYTGITTDVGRRFQAHSQGKGAKYLKYKRPLALVFEQSIGDRSLASKVEYAIKQLPKQKKELIVQGELDCRQLVETNEV